MERFRRMDGPVEIDAFDVDEWKFVDWVEDFIRRGGSRARTSPQGSSATRSPVATMYSLPPLYACHRHGPSRAKHPG